MDNFANDDDFQNGVDEGEMQVCFPSIVVSEGGKRIPETETVPMKTSEVEAGSSLSWETNFVEIKKPRVHVRHRNSGKGGVYKTYLLEPGTIFIAYILDPGTRNVAPGKYDHAASYAGGEGKGISTLNYE